ncbi:MAG: DUF3955 domain-containing protein [Erysipelotrichaceae bacterium]|nr:DUF3955 domain-containing protein [Erysipelotrichaceae bacterium]
MNFKDTIKKIREDNKMSQEDFADVLGVTRQAVSNWENERNLPDIEMIISISEKFTVSLDELILGEKRMSEKLIKDGSETSMAKHNKTSFMIGAVLMCIGMVLIIIKGLSVDYIDEAGILHENFFLLPIGFAFIFAGLIVFVIQLIRYLISLRNK